MKNLLINGDAMSYMFMKNVVVYKKDTTYHLQFENSETGCTYEFDLVEDPEDGEFKVWTDNVNQLIFHLHPDGAIEYSGLIYYFWNTIDDTEMSSIYYDADRIHVASRIFDDEARA